MHVAQLQCIVYNPWKNYQIPPGRYGGVARKRIFFQICPSFALKQWIYANELINMQMNDTIFILSTKLIYA
jgi:hypothetical protein